MDNSVIVMIVTLAMPSGEESVSVKPMANADQCRAEAKIEASDPFVARVVCSELDNGVLKLNFRGAEEREVPDVKRVRAAG